MKNILMTQDTFSIKELNVVFMLSITVKIIIVAKIDLFFSSLTLFKLILLPIH